MSVNAMSLKAKIKNLAKEKNIRAQVILQNYIFERFLERLSLSEYKSKFILKGGMLVATIVGMGTRSTMDLDTTLRGLPFTEESIRKTITEICVFPIDDDVSIEVGAVSPIRPDDVYGGYRVKMTAFCDTIEIPFVIDISTGDVITPQAVIHTFQGILDENKWIEIWAYNIETVMAEKIETILRRNIFSTRLRDYYDIYILSTTQKYDVMLLRKAVFATAEHRGTSEQISDIEALLKLIADSAELRKMWEKYRLEFDYASNISYEQTMKALNDVCAVLKEDI